MDPSAPLAKPLFLKLKEEGNEKRKKDGLSDFRRRAYTLPPATALRRKRLRPSLKFLVLNFWEDAISVFSAIRPPVKEDPFWGHLGGFSREALSFLKFPED